MWGIQLEPACNTAVNHYNKVLIDYLLNIYLVDSYITYAFIVQILVGRPRGSAHSGLWFVTLRNFVFGV